MMIGSGTSKSTPVNVAPMWNSAPPGTTPGAPPDQPGLPADHGMRKRLYVTPLNSVVPLGPLTTGLIHGLEVPVYDHDTLTMGSVLKKSIARLWPAAAFGLTRSQLCMVWIDSPTFCASRPKPRSL